MAVPVIGAADVEHRLDWREMVAALAEGHRGPAPRIGDLFLTRGEDTLLSRSAWIDGLGVAVKSVTVVPGNPARGLPSVHGALVLFGDATGRVEAVIDAGLVTKWKTAADSVLGATLLARAGSRRLLIVGTGAVAASLVEAYRAVCPGIEVTVWGRSPEKALAFAAAHGVAAAGDLAAAVGAADVVATATMAREPVLRGEWLRPGQHLDLIGAFRADMREADDDAIRRARVFVDSRETTVGHIGELMIPIAAGVMRAEDVAGDLADLVAGRAGRRSDDEITLFKNGGGAHLDLMTARVILAVWRGAGSEVPAGESR
jgi:ornithine cyclodeaminase/alanine dehydrogenase-like protein (mu-crystallin family)